jgi:hypothetical protein
MFKNGVRKDRILNSSEMHQSNKHVPLLNSNALPTMANSKS